MNVNQEARIQIKTTQDIKSTLSRAATLSHQSISAFLLDAAFERAKNVLKAHEMITLSNVERERFFTLLETSDEPNDALKVAMSEYLEEQTQ